MREIDAHVCARVCQHLGAGRLRSGQQLDLAVGLTMTVETGDYLQSGELTADSQLELAVM